jgi:hypothetical protein
METWARTRKWPVPGNMTYSLTPLEPDQKLEDLYNDPPDSWRFYRLNTRCNTTLDPDYVRNIEENESPELVETRMTGAFAHFEGAVYPNFNGRLHVVEPFEVHRDWLRITVTGCRDRVPHREDNRVHRSPSVSMYGGNGPGGGLAGYYGGESARSSSRLRLKTVKVPGPRIAPRRQPVRLRGPGPRGSEAGARAGVEEPVEHDPPEPQDSYPGRVSRRLRKPIRAMRSRAVRRGMDRHGLTRAGRRWNRMGPRSAGRSPSSAARAGAPRAATRGPSARRRSGRTCPGRSRR